MCVEVFEGSTCSCSGKGDFSLHLLVVMTALRVVSLVA